MASLSMIRLTIPMFVPIIMAMGFGLPPEELAIWFGIIALIVVEVGLITPPVGMNLFIIQGVAKAPLSEVVNGAWPFAVMMLIKVILLWCCRDLALSIAYG